MDRSQPLTEALFYILLAARKPVHGYGIIQEVAEMTGGRVNLGPGTLYGAINVLLDRGWIVLYSAEMGSRRKRSTSSQTRAGRPLPGSCAGCGSWCPTAERWRMRHDPMEVYL